MPIGTIDVIYTVKLYDGRLVEMTSGQYRRYKIMLKVLYVLFYPISKTYQWLNKSKKSDRKLKDNK
jgi:hypothetical protein